MFPILFEFGPLTIYSRWFFITIGFIAGAMCFVRIAKKLRFKFDPLAQSSFGLFLWTLLCARVFFIITHPELYFYHFSAAKLLNFFTLWDKGLSFWGALLGWFSGIWYIFRGVPELRLKLLDTMMLALLIGIFFGNIGAFLDGINYGIPTDLPWGMAFESAQVKYITAIHPTQLYAAFYTLVLALGVYALYIKRLRGGLPGFTSLVTVFAFSACKFIEEFVRGDETIKVFSLRLPQILALAAAITSAYFLYIHYIKTGAAPQGLVTFIHQLRQHFTKKEEIERAQQSSPLSPEVG